MDEETLPEHVNVDKNRELKPNHYVVKTAIVQLGIYRYRLQSFHFSFKAKVGTFILSQACRFLNQRACFFSSELPWIRLFDVTLHCLDFGPKVFARTLITLPIVFAQGLFKTKVHMLNDPCYSSGDLSLPIATHN